MPLYLLNGVLLRVADALAADENCCCVNQQECCPGVDLPEEVTAEFTRVSPGPACDLDGLELDLVRDPDGGLRWTMESAYIVPGRLCQIDLELECTGTDTFTLVNNDRTGMEGQDLFEESVGDGQWASVSVECEPLEIVFDDVYADQFACCGDETPGNQFIYTVTIRPKTP